MADKGQEQAAPRALSEQRGRIAKSARQLAGYANFLRWSANFPKEELSRHPRHERVMLLSPMQSGRFSFCIEQDTIYLGVQPFEAVWLACMPIDRVYVSDRLYLSIDGVACIDNKLPALGLGVFVDDQEKRARMAKAKWLQPMLVKVGDGQVVAVERELGAPIAVSGADIVGSLAAVAGAKIKQQDISRFF